MAPRHTTVSRLNVSEATNHIEENKIKLKKPNGAHQNIFINKMSNLNDVIIADVQKY